MKHLVILGAGTAGTLMSRHLAAKLPPEWKLSIVDERSEHHYQPGYLFIPFGIYRVSDILKPVQKFLPKRAQYIQRRIERVAHKDKQVHLAGAQVLNYDILIIATGSDIAPSETEGLLGPHWYRDVFDFYSLAGAEKLYQKLRDWPGGKLVVHISEMPIKCPVAPLEFAFLADDFFRKKGMRDKVEISYVTPMDGAFTKPVASKTLGHLLEQKNISVVPNFNVMEVEGEKRLLRDYEGREVSYDLLVTVPTNMGADYVERSGLGDELNFIPTHKHSLKCKLADDIFVLGDATNLPTSKAGSVAHFQGEVLVDNILRYLRGEALQDSFDGHANCFVETGRGKALLIDFNYDTQPLPGRFPLPILGPMALLRESRLNHWGKLAFKWIYWQRIVTGKPIPFVTAKMKTAGKELAAAK